VLGALPEADEVVLSVLSGRSVSLALCNVPACPHSLCLESFTWLD
jgi:hypothetical protein